MKMALKNKKPIIGVPVNHTPATENTSALFMTAEKYARVSMEISDTSPILIPAFGKETDFETILNTIDGLLLTGTTPLWWSGVSSRRNYRPTT
jgi:putative glutamine amidotransferase